MMGVAGDDVEELADEVHAWIRKQLPELRLAR